MPKRKKRGSRGRGASIPKIGRFEKHDERENSAFVPALKNKFNQPGVRGFAAGWVPECILGSVPVYHSDGSPIERAETESARKDIVFLIKWQGISKQVDFVEPSAVYEKCPDLVAKYYKETAVQQEKAMEKASGQASMNID